MTLFAFILSSCKSGVESRERLAWYMPFVPQNLSIEKFYETASPSMDHEYMWKIKIEDTADYRKFEKQLTAAPSNVDGVNDYSSVAEFDEHPDWWKDIDFTKGGLHKHRVQVVGSGGGEWANVFALVDKEAGFLYIQAF